MKCDTCRDFFSSEFINDTLEKHTFIYTFSIKHEEVPYFIKKVPTNTKICMSNKMDTLLSENHLLCNVVITAHTIFFCQQNKCHSDLIDD